MITLSLKHSIATALILVLASISALSCTVEETRRYAGGNVAGGGFVTIFSSQLIANTGNIQELIPVVIVPMIS